MYGSSPPPPPDYTAEKRQIRLDTEAGYKKKADEYNTAVDNYNTALSGYNTTLGNLSGSIGGMTMRDLYDNPNTAENENRYSSLLADLGSLNTNLGSLSLGVDKPVFDSTVNSEYGAVGITNIPTLNAMNSNLYTQLNNNVGSLTNTLNNLNKQRQAEEQRISDFRTGLLGDIGGYNTTLGQLGIADLNQMNQMERDLASLNAKRNAFSSSILDQMYPQGFTQFDSTYNSLTSGLQDLRAQRAAEEQRIKQYEQGLLGSADSFRNTLSGYNIASEAGMNELQALIDQKQREAGRFSSELGFNFNDELGDIADVELALNKLQRERADELSRISTAEQNYLNTARGIEQAAETGNIYSAAGLNAIQDNLRDLQGKMGGFSSLLDYDFSGATGSINDAQAALAALNEKRQSELDKIAGGITGATEGLADLNLYDEAGIRDRLAQLRTLEGSLAPFSGGRVDSIQSQIGGGIDQVNARLTELANYRANLEQRAQQLMETVNNASYYGTGDLTDNQSAYDAIQAEAELYNASQAMDEVDAIMNRLNSERQRLEADAEAVAARQNAAQQRLTLGTSGLPTFQDLSQVDPMTLQQYLAMLASQEEEPIPLGLSPSAFSNALGVIRVG